jgi:tRNA A37 threonylcarbamoyladenosine modification protein TsaB
MMILAIETATIDVGVALVDENRTLLSSSVRTNREHGAQLHPAIKELMATCHVEFSGIDAICGRKSPRHGALRSPRAREEHRGSSL